MCEFGSAFGRNIQYFTIYWPLEFWADIYYAVGLCLQFKSSFDCGALESLHQKCEFAASEMYVNFDFS